MTALGLCLFLALTSIGLAVARGAAQPVGQIVLCTSEGRHSVAVDARGQPVAPPHVCPECLLGFYADTPRPPLQRPHAATASLCHPVTEARHAVSLARPAPLARAPPAPA